MCTQEECWFAPKGTQCVKCKSLTSVDIATMVIGIIKKQQKCLFIRNCCIAGVICILQCFKDVCGYI